MQLKVYIETNEGGFEPIEHRPPFETAYSIPEMMTETAYIGVKAKKPSVAWLAEGEDHHPMGGINKQHWQRRVLRDVWYIDVESAQDLITICYQSAGWCQLVIDQERPFWLVIGRKRDE